MKSKILTTRYVKELTKGLKNAGYNLITEDNDGALPLYRVDFDGETIFWAMPHSNGRNYLVSYSPELLTESEA